MMLYFISPYLAKTNVNQKSRINKISYWIRIESFFKNTTLQFLLEVQGNLYHTLR